MKKRNFIDLGGMTSEITEQSNAAFIIQYQIAQCICPRRLVYRRDCRLLAGEC